MSQSFTAPSPLTLSKSRIIRVLRDWVDYDSDVCSREIQRNEMRNGNDSFFKNKPSENLRRTFQLWCCSTVDEQTSRILPSCPSAL
ncbi:hypothetical protein J4Q44_G00191450 [Coregonus suidteri]|uniref:Uncharacterized protein n=1 Tax=Coregonus suidteri TaxID=861788 RepID=A0AAN8QPH0_9TELE